MFNPITTIQTDVAGALKQASWAFLIARSPFWPNVIALPQLQAYNLIVTHLAERGFTPAQIAAWDAGPEYERVIALYYALTENGVMAEAGQQYVSKYERYLNQLRFVDVTIGGAVADPLGVAGQASTGIISQGQNEFVYPNPYDPRIGAPTRF